MAASAVRRPKPSAAVRKPRAATVLSTVAMWALRRPVVWVGGRTTTVVAAQALCALSAVLLELGLRTRATTTLACRVATELAPAVRGGATSEALSRDEVCGWVLCAIYAVLLELGFPKRAKSTLAESLGTVPAGQRRRTQSRTRRSRILLACRLEMGVLGCKTEPGWVE